LSCACKDCDNIRDLREEIDNYDLVSLTAATSNDMLLNYYY